MIVRLEVQDFTERLLEEEKNANYESFYYMECYFSRRVVSGGTFAGENRRIKKCVRNTVEWIVHIFYMGRIDPVEYVGVSQ